MDGMASTGTKLLAATIADVVMLCQGMRQDEREQFLAVGPFDAYDPELAARTLIAKQGPSFSIVAEDGMPIVVGGFEPVGVGVWQTWMVTSDAAWSGHGLAITRHTRRTMDALLISESCHRIQTTALASREQALTWYERGLRMRREGVLRGFGKHGEDVAIFARVRGD